MVTKGIIQTIDFNGNTCTVRLPYFETASINDPIILNATLLIVPGIYNGYKPNDVVLVAFEDGQINNPVVIGKLFLGTNKESAESRSAINVTNFKADQSATIPVDTKLTYAGDDKNRAAVAKDLSTYKTIADIIKSIQNHSEKIGSATAQLIDDGVKLGAKVDKVNDGNTTGFGWELTDSGWAIFAKNSEWALRDRLDLMTIDSSGTTFLGKVRILDYPIDTETRYMQTSSNAEAPKKPDAKENPTNWNDWKLAMPERVEGQYIWSCIRTVKYVKASADATTLTEETTYSDPVCLSGTDGIGVAKVIDLFIPWDTTSEKSPQKPDNNIYDKNNPMNWAYKVKIINEDGSEGEQLIQWYESPDGHSLEKNQTWWTCIATVYTDNKISYSTPIKNNAYALAQGKSTNYYSDSDPSSTNAIKEGDCWFETIQTEDGQRQRGNLKQWTNGKWTDIGGELVANKVTANFVSALGITAKSIKILDENNDTLFEADGTAKQKVNDEGKPQVDADGNELYDIVDGSVTMAGWKATKDSFYGGDLTKGTYTKIQIPDENVNATNSLSSPFTWDSETKTLDVKNSLFNLEVVTAETLRADYSLVPNDTTQFKLRKQDDSNQLLERDNYYVWDITPIVQNNDTKPYLAIVKLTYQKDAPLYNFNIYLSGLFNTVSISDKETSVNFIAATEVFNKTKLEKTEYKNEADLLKKLCYTETISNGVTTLSAPTKANPNYVLAMDNTNIFYTGKINYVYPQLNKGDYFYIIQYVQQAAPKVIPGATSTGTSTAYNDIKKENNSIVKYNRGTFFIERQVDTSKNVFDVSTNFRVSELGNLQSLQSLRAYNTIKAERVECGSWKLWPEQLVKEDFELRSNQIKLATARSTKFYDKTTLTMRVRSNTQADETATASTATNTVISQGELSCDHPLSIRGKNYLRLSALSTIPTKDEEAQVILSADTSSATQQSMLCAAMTVSGRTYSTGGFLGIGATPHTEIKIKVARIANGNYPMINSVHVTVYCLCNNKIYTISGMLGTNIASFEETITIDGKTINIQNSDQIKFRWNTYGSWSSQPKRNLAGFNDSTIDDANICSYSTVINRKVATTTGAVIFNSTVLPFASDKYSKYSLGDNNHYWQNLYVTNSVTTSSDFRLKKDIKLLNIQDFDALYDKLQPVSFKFKTDGEGASTRLGFIAQEVDAALAETNHADLGIVSRPGAETGYYGLQYEQFIMLNMLQIKQLKKELTDLQQKYDLLEKQVNLKEK